MRINKKYYISTPMAWTFTYFQETYPFNLHFEIIGGDMESLPMNGQISLKYFS